MVHVIDRHTVQKKQVLIRVSSAYIQSGCGFGSGHHARQQLESLENVCLTKHCGNSLDLLNRNVNCTHL